ncbi:MAG: DUF4919 domain-containing protein [Muribaculaceae bacterium]|nr:DUF4919 domain-containing protein [Muribaculaceae bacterium]MDE7141920.1 DUF4919 domain-containing protein [Muribaculaceae bacterium]
MNRNSLLFIVIALVALAFPARAVDYNAMQVEVTMHPDRYRALLNRFVAGDTTLTSPELAMVYYGYSFTPDYDPRETFDQITDAFDVKDYEQVARMTPDALVVNPVSLDLSVMAFTAAERGAGERPGMRAANLGLRCDMIATAILESGRGTSPDSPFKVISSADIGRLLRNVLGISVIVGRTKCGDVDAIKVTFPDSDRQHILYFDNTREAMFLARRGASAANNDKH